MIALKKDIEEEYLDVDEIKEFLEGYKMPTGDFIRHLHNGNIKISSSSLEMMEKLESDFTYSKELYEKLLNISVQEALNILKKFNKKGTLSDVKNKTIADILVDYNDKCFRLSSGKVIYVG